MNSPTEYPDTFSSSENSNSMFFPEILSDHEPDPEALAFLQSPEMSEWLNEDWPLPSSEPESSVWVPLSAADRSWADQLAEKHPDPDFAEHLRQMTLAAAALTRYLESHGIEVDRSAANHNHAVVQLLNPTADVVLPNLGKLEAVLVQTTEDNRCVVDVDLASGTLAYVVVSLEGGGARLQGLLFCSDLHQDWPEGGTVPVTMAKPLDELWSAYGDWSRWQQILTQWCEKKGEKLPQELAEVITIVQYAYSHVTPFRRSSRISYLLNEKSDRDRSAPSENLMTVREEGTEQEDSKPPAIDWLSEAENWLDEFDRWKQSP